ncbi:CatB-related O-acetyltransferase [Clostridium baratii]|uniref:CatB-related O-acetyltransferase n=1 Tax=Clostridium baratii TaxID=1561 RepID=UPI001CAF843E|nr:CatB-related O-acetyltransferase [Clostridium baratii]STA98783.1 phosphonate metabolim protein, transferase hexapeptide repeat family [Clostridium baratii]
MRRVLVLLRNVVSLPLRIFTKVSIFAIIQDSNIDKTSAISSGSKFYRSSIDKYSYIGRNNFIIDTEIGKFCCIAPGCNIGGTGHPINWVSTSSVFHKWDNILKKNFSRHEYNIFSKTRIGNDVWIATNAMIKAGVKISDGAVIGMGAVITKDVGPYEVWVGNPAICIKKRFDDDIIEKLLRIKWWDYNDNELEEKSKYFNDINSFIENFYEES